MQTRRNGTLTRYRGRLTLDGLILRETATVVNHGLIHTWTTISDGTVRGSGTWWARYDTSKPVGGEIESTQIIVYWPTGRRFVLPVVCGGLICIPDNIGEGGLT